MGRSIWSSTVVYGSASTTSGRAICRCVAPSMSPGRITSGFRTWSSCRLTPRLRRSISRRMSRSRSARGSRTSDTDGARQGTLLIPRGTDASIIQPDGQKKVLKSLNVRVTEYTVGAWPGGYACAVAAHHRLYLCLRAECRRGAGRRRSQGGRQGRAAQQADLPLRRELPRLPCRHDCARRVL